MSTNPSNGMNDRKRGAAGWCAAAALLLGTVAATWLETDAKPVAVPVLDKAVISLSPVRPVYVSRECTLPGVISEYDKAAYRSITALQEAAEWERADQIIAKLGNRLLVGHVLAARYLSRGYDSKSGELAAWLDRYADHPEAYDIYALAQAKFPALTGLPEIAKPVTLQGFGDDNGLAAREDAVHGLPEWHAAMMAWKTGEKALAARLFSQVADKGDALSAWELSSASFWAWRANKAVGDQARARHYLEIAATAPRSFYGILASRQLRQPLKLDLEPVAIGMRDVLELYSEPALRRAIALVQTQQHELAESELRKLFPQSTLSEKRKILGLAHRLGLASVQISMASALSRRDERTHDYARYPVPHWEPASGFSVDPALIYSLARQESGFRATALSQSGAMGVMQLMPQTAWAMQRQLYKNRAAGQPSTSLAAMSEPALNVTLGQSYMEHLLDLGAVDGNLVYLLTAYNAGPGKLVEWKQDIDGQNDPLLFIESIPYQQTRHYVMQVMTNYWIYGEIMGREHDSAQSLLSGHWPVYQGYRVPVASAGAAPRG